MGIEEYQRSELLHLHNSFMGCGGDPRTQNWLNANRLYFRAHQSVLSLIKAFAGRMYKDVCRFPKSIDAKKRAYKNETGKEFEFQVYTPDKMNQMSFGLKVATVFTWAFLIAGPVSLFFGLRFLKGFLYAE